MTEIFDACADTALLGRLRGGMHAALERLSWESTTRDVLDLVSRAR
jgi:hypothetical protein